MTAFQDVYAAAKAIMTDVDTASTGTIVQAPTNYGLNFKITPGEGLYQVQITPEMDWLKSANVAFPRAVVVVLLHHYRDDLANEEEFLHITMQEFSDRFLVRANWQTRAGIYDLQPDLDPEMDDGGRVGNVITFEGSAAVLMDAV